MLVLAASSRGKRGQSSKEGGKEVETGGCSALSDGVFFGDLECLPVRARARLVKQRGNNAREGVGAVSATDCGPRGGEGVQLDECRRRKQICDYY